MQPALSERAIDGELVCPMVSTETDEHGSRRDRWWTIELYRLRAGGYLAHRVGLSRVYHMPRTSCRTAARTMPGRPIRSLDELPADAGPCTVCQPPWPEELARISARGRLVRVRFEVPRHTWIEGTPEQIITELITSRSRSGKVTTRPSEPVERLLEAAAKADPAFAQR